MKRECKITVLETNDEVIIESKAKTGYSYIPDVLRVDIKANEDGFDVIYDYQKHLQNTD